MALAGLLAAALLPEIGDRWWIADLFSHFRFQYLAIAAVVAALALLLWRPLLAVAAVTLAMPHAVVIANVPVAGSATAASSTAPVRVMTANIQWRNRRVDEMIAHFRASHADVIALQETTSAALPVLDALLDRYPHRAPADWRHAGSGVVMLSRYPLADVRHLTAAGAPIVSARVRHPHGDFRFIAVHAPYPVNDALYEAHKIYFVAMIEEARRSETPIVVAGDFNLTPWSPRFRAAWRTTGLAFAGNYRVWPRSWPAHAVPIHYLPALIIGGMPIDHVLIGRDFAVRSARRGPYIGSDHYPITVELVPTR